jgi:lipopolysaccharide transport system ATP-binding protein
MTDIVIKANNLGKKYTIGHQAENGRYTALRDVLMQHARSLWHKTRDLLQGKPIVQGDTLEEVWALKDVTFEVRRGEVVGIIGRNGAGKSTLLKILSRITEPSSGRVLIKGRVASLLEVGTGFHPELTGRQNIYLNGAIMGMKKAEIDRKFDGIVAFAEVEKFLDTPVKRYSSGMYMRLAFAVAAHLEPEILLVDEVLAVGDAAFQKKCLGKMRDVAQAGRTILFISHNLQAVQNLCNWGLFLSHGSVAFVGPVQDAVRYYLESIQQGAAKPLEENPDREGNGAVRLKNVYTCDERGIICKDFVAGEPLVFNFEYVRNRRCRTVNLGFTIFNRLGTACTHINTSNFDFDLDGLGEHGHIICRIDRNPLPVGEYRVSVVLDADEAVADYLPGCFSFQVVASHFFPSMKAPNPEIIYCPVMVDHQWDHIPG